ncbi:MAG: peptidyl-prolyl cis-trans isomerase [Anaerolineae bacterium]|nr:peptidyl-prolyl cis-trans isomerase [Anaerolineae bacterium]
MENSIYLLDRTLKLDVYFDPEDSQFNDNICISICEDCPEESEKVLIADETNVYLTEEQAKQLADALLAAIKQAKAASRAKK